MQDISSLCLTFCITTDTQLLVQPHFMACLQEYTKRADAINAPPPPPEQDTTDAHMDSEATDKKRKLESPTNEQVSETGPIKKQTLVASENTKSKLAAFANKQTSTYNNNMI